jgi:hypothetical protein
MALSELDAAGLSMAKDHRSAVAEMDRLTVLTGMRDAAPHVFPFFHGDRRAAYADLLFQEFAL